MTVSDALEAYRREVLPSKPASSQDTGRWLIGKVKRDPISAKSLAALQANATIELAALRDRTITDANVKAAAKALAKGSHDADTTAKLKQVEAGSLSKGETLKLFASLGIKSVSTSSIKNTLAIVRSAFKHAAETTPGLTALPSVKMPKADPHRTRRPTEAELKRLLEAAAEIDP